MSKQDAYVEKAQARIDESVARLDQLKAQAKGEMADKKVAMYQQVEKLEANLEIAREKLAEIKGSAEGAWEAMTERFDVLYSEMNSSFKKFIN